MGQLGLGCCHRQRLASPRSESMAPPAHARPHHVGGPKVHPRPAPTIEHRNTSRLGPGIPPHHLRCPPATGASYRAQSWPGRPGCCRKLGEAGLTSNRRVAAGCARDRPPPSLVSRGTASHEWRGFVSMSPHKAAVGLADRPPWSIPSLREPRCSQSRVPRTMKEVRCRTNRRMRCCMRDGEAGRLFVWWQLLRMLLTDASASPC